MKLLLATHNIGKIESYKKYLKYMSGLEIVTLQDLGIIDDIEETGRTFKENALLKAKFFAEKTNLITLGDDGGLEIKNLNNEPGIYSRRWPYQNTPESHKKATDMELVEYTLEKMKHILPNERQACLTTTVIIYFPQNQEYETFVESINGYITTEMPNSIIAGFPFRSIFYIPKYKKVFQDLNEEENREVDHRQQLCNKIIQYLQIKK